MAGRVPGIGEVITGHRLKFRICFVNERFCSVIRKRKRSAKTTSWGELDMDLRPGLAEEPNACRCNLVVESRLSAQRNSVLMRQHVNIQVYELPVGELLATYLYPVEPESQPSGNPVAAAVLQGAADDDPFHSQL